MIPIPSINRLHERTLESGAESGAGADVLVLGFEFLHFDVSGCQFFLQRFVCLGWV